MLGDLSIPLMCLLIFFARICDVSLGTIRIIFISKGKKILAPFIGFIEVLIWLVAFQQILSNLTNFWLYIAYACGYSAGTLVGILIEDKLSIGKILVRIITTSDITELVTKLKKDKFVLTITDAQGREGKAKVIMTVINRKKQKQITKIIKELAPNAFYVIEEIKDAKEMNYFGEISPKRIHPNRKVK